MSGRVDASVGRRAPATPARPGSALRDVRIRRDVREAPGAQLEGQVALMVREGRLAPGRRLPSTRRMASRHGLHRNTVAAAYRRLAAGGLIEVRHGARATVAAPRWSPPADDPAAVPPRCSPARSPADRVRVVALASDPGTARLMAAELRAALPGTVRVEAVVAGQTGEGAAVGGAGSGDGLAVALPGPAARRLEAEAGAAPVIARQAPRPELSRSLLRARTLAVAAVLTGSAALRSAVRCDARRLRGGEVTLRAADPARPREARAALEAADLAIADRLARAAFCGPPPPADARRVIPIRLLARETLDRVGRAHRASGGASPAQPRREEIP